MSSAPPEPFEIRASTTEEARVQAEKVLQADPGRILLQAGRPGLYLAWLLDPVEGVSLRLGQDRPAFVRLFETDQGQPDLDRTKLLGELHRSGLHAEPLDQGLDRLLTSVVEAGAGGELDFQPAGPLRPPEGCSFKLSGQADLPVFPGQEVAEIMPRSGDEDGDDRPGGSQASGQAGPVEEPRCFDGAGCAFDESGQKVLAGRFGLARLQDGGLWIAPLLNVSADGCTLSAPVFPRDSFGSQVSLDGLAALMTPFAEGLTFQRKTVDRALQSAIKTGRPQQAVPLAVGRPPVKGRDGRFELAQPQSDRPAESDVDRQDPRERQLFFSLEAGETIGLLRPPGSGRPGLDVFGNQLPALPGDPKEMEAGENVEMSGDSASGQPVAFRAAISGVVSIQDRTVAVSEVLDIAGDVDYSTGNVRLDRGAVRIAGNVKPGFSVEVPREVSIQGLVDDASITAGGSIAIHGGVVAEHAGRIQAGGSVQAQFAENVTVQAGGDVVINQNITNCRIEAEGRVLCTSGRGGVQGGSVRSSKGIEVNVAGSKLGVVTRLAVESDLTGGRALMDERTGLRDQIGKIEQKLGGLANDQSRRERLSEEKQAAVSRLLQIKTDAERRIEEIELRLRQLKEQQLELMRSARIEIKKTAHPDTIIAFWGREHRIREVLSRTVFRFDPETRQIVSKARGE